MRGRRDEDGEGETMVSEETGARAFFGKARHRGAETDLGDSSCNRSRSPSHIVRAPLIIHKNRREIGDEFRARASA